MSTNCRAGAKVARSDHWRYYDPLPREVKERVQASIVPWDCKLLFDAWRNGKSISYLLNWITSWDRQYLADQKTGTERFFGVSHPQVPEQRRNKITLEGLGL